MSFESIKFEEENQAESEILKKNPESGHEKLVRSLCQRFKKAIAASIMPAVAAATFVFSTPDKIGFNKEDVSRMLNNQVEVSSYIKAADIASKEGEMEKEERQTTAKAAYEGMVIEDRIGKNDLDWMISLAPPRPESSKSPDIVLGSSDEFKKIGLNFETLRSSVNELPEKWRKNINSISCKMKPEDPSLKNKYGIENSEVIAKARHNRESGLTDITFFESFNKWSEDDIKEAVRHEAAHANDWKSRDRHVNQRINMLYEIIGRAKNSNRFRSLYVESIKNPDKQQELVLKSNEYWAEIASAYFSGKDLPPADKDLVEKFK